ncbi:MAG TPA: hypothetical protein VHS80_03015, partial [Chthoniobacterales bacterium]|nr:hypothetical protein [Chthoniobacterales bacterium]
VENSRRCVWRLALAVAATVQPKFGMRRNARLAGAACLNYQESQSPSYGSTRRPALQRLALIYRSRSDRKSRTLRRRLHSMVGVGQIPCARAAWFGMLLTFGWTVAATVPGKPHERTMRPPKCAEVFALTIALSQFPALILFTVVIG